MVVILCLLLLSLDPEHKAATQGLQRLLQGEGDSLGSNRGREGEEDEEEEEGGEVGDDGSGASEGESEMNGVEDILSVDFGEGPFNVEVSR